MVTIREALKDGAAALARSGIDGARLDSRLLLGHALGRPVWPHEEGIVAEDVLARFRSLIGRRLDREPVSKIVGRRGFWTLDLEVTADTLDPRPDSEALIEAALEAFGDRAPPRRVLDLGTGTGCLLLAVLSEFPDAIGVGIERSRAAAEVAYRNAAATGLAERVEIRCQDWSTGDFDGGFDLVLSNPPYIAEGEIAGLDREVRAYDPVGALAAGRDGLDAYRSLAPVLRRALTPEGFAVLELGVGQADAVASIMMQAGSAEPFLVESGRKTDLGGIVRALVLKWNYTRSSTP